MDSVGDNRVAWSSFMAFSQVIDDVLSDPTEVVSEREAFLLRELQSMFEAEGLLASPNDVVVVAARNAWPEYNNLHAYICQPGRSFQHVKYVAFYSHGVIHPLVPKILAPHDDVALQRNVHKGELDVLVNRLLDEQLRPEGHRFKVLLLSVPISPETVVLPEPVRNDKLSSSGKSVAFTMGQRYTTLARLLSAKTTSGLD